MLRIHAVIVELISHVAPIATAIGRRDSALEKQLRDNGFDVTFKLFDPDTNPFFDIVRAGKGDMWVIVHCGSSNEPYGTLQHFHEDLDRSL